MLMCALSRLCSVGAFSRAFACNMFSRVFKGHRFTFASYSTTCFPALSSGDRFFCAFDRLNVFPRFLVVTCLLKLFTASIVFPLFALVTIFLLQALSGWLRFFLRYDTQFHEIFHLLNCFLFSPFCTDIPYHITIITGNKPSAGTDANVYIALHGDKGETPRTALQDESQTSKQFQRRRADKFSLQTADVGKVRK